jgi:DNA modification methylase
LQETVVSAADDLWILGHHRVLVGDATCPDDVQRLMAGDAADLVFTDPPYNVDYEGYTETAEDSRRPNDTAAIPAIPESHVR